MATGIVKGEKKGDDAITADTVKTEPFPLPSDKLLITFDYPNKLEYSDLLSLDSCKYIKVIKNKSPYTARKISANSLIWADNIYALRDLINQYSGKINLIYLDPPYGTGFDFQSRNLKHAYNDNLSVVQYLEFMRRRLILMRELLSSEGSIYIHIGYQMLFHLKIIMDEVFGPKNFRNLIVRKKCSSKNYTKKQYPNLNDYILFYTKSKSYIWNRPGTLAPEEWVKKEYPKQDNKGRYKLVPIHAPGIRKGETGKPWKGMNPPPGKHWQLTPKKLDELDRAGFIHWSKNGNPRRKVYLEERKSIPFTDYWDIFRDAHHQSIKITGYPTEKNLLMLKTIISASSNAGDLVLDPFCGSGTTLHAAGDLERKWLGIDQSMNAIDTCINRFKNGLSPMGDYVDNASKSKCKEPDKQNKKTVLNNKISLYIEKEFFESHRTDVNKIIKKL